MRVRSATIAAIMAFIVTWMMGAQDADADVYLDFGQLQNESDATFGGLGYTYKDKWDASVIFVGEGEGDNYTTPKMKIASISRLIYPVWTEHHFYMGAGISKTKLKAKGAQIGVWNYKLQLGWDFGRSKIFYHHHSSGDVNKVNVGVDMIGVEFKF